jgi:hypothetical protein
VDENNESDTESSIAYLYSTTSVPSTIINLDDYCRLFECRSRMCVIVFEYNLYRILDNLGF